MAENEKEPGVGYRRPPKLSRFKPGQSGNPRGRPRGARNLATDLSDELAESIRIRESGKELRVSKQRAMIKSLVAAAVQGDVRATNALVSLCGRLLVDRNTEGSKEALSVADTKILDEFIDREIERRSRDQSSTAQINQLQTDTQNDD